VTGTNTGHERGNGALRAQRKQAKEKPERKKALKEERVNRAPG
jgi:hypothetical protein